EQEIMKTNEEKSKKNYQMLLFCLNVGLSIEYDENNNTFQFNQLTVCDDIASLNSYSYVCINDIVLLFGGWNGKADNRNIVSKSVYKYSIRENKWTTFKNTLPSQLRDSIAILDEENNHIYIIGGSNKKGKVSNHVEFKALSTHMKTK
ncbi:hypothetical protein RFI_35751, partial [Reticulomyxa filosa]